MNKEELYKRIILDLVNLAVKSNDVIIKGTFTGKNADEVNEVLTMCKEIYQQYTVQENE